MSDLWKCEVPDDIDLDEYMNELEFYELMNEDKIYSTCVCCLKPVDYILKDSPYKLSLKPEWKDDRVCKECYALRDKYLKLTLEREDILRNTKTSKRGFYKFSEKDKRRVRKIIDEMPNGESVKTKDKF